MAALRAKTIHKITSVNNLIISFKSKGEYPPMGKVADEKWGANIPIKKPIMANGKAKIVWENFTKPAYFFILFIQINYYTP